MALTDWLISYYKADTGSWTTLFDAHWTNDWTLTSTALWTTSWKIWWWLTNDWTSRYVNIPKHIPRVTDWIYTIWAWIKWDWTNINWWIYSYWNSGNWNYNFFFYISYTLRIYCRNSSVSSYIFIIETVETLDPSLDYLVWVEVNWNIKTLKLFLNWQEAQTTIISNWTPSEPTFNSYHLWCVRYTSPSYFFNWWYYDEIFIYNRILTQEEWDTIYNNWDGLQYPFTTPTLKKWNIFFWFGGG